MKEKTHKKMMSLAVCAICVFFSPKNWKNYEISFRRVDRSEWKSRWWQLNFFLIFIPNMGEDSTDFDVRIFFRWVGEKPPTRNMFEQIF